MTKQPGEAAESTTVMTRWVQAAVLTTLLYLIAQLYPSALMRTTEVQLQEANDTLLAWQTRPSDERRDAPTP